MGSQCLSTTSNQSLADHWGMWMHEPQEAGLKYQKEEKKKAKQNQAETLATAESTLGTIYYLTCQFSTKDYEI